MRLIDAEIGQGRQEPHADVHARTWTRAAMKFALRLFFSSSECFLGCHGICIFLDLFFFIYLIPPLFIIIIIQGVWGLMEVGVGCWWWFGMIIYGIPFIFQYIIRFLLWICALASSLGIHCLIIFIIAISIGSEARSRLPCGLSGRSCSHYRLESSPETFPDAAASVHCSMAVEHPRLG